MSERDLRSAFNQLKDDVMMNVQTEERLEQITQPHAARRRPVVAAMAALAGAAAVALVVGGVVLALRPTGNDPVPPATGGPSATVVDTTTDPTPTTEVPTTLLPAAVPGTVLIADRDVVAIEQGDGYIAYLADRVVGDGAQGIVIQIDQRLVQILPDGESNDLVRASDLAADVGPVTIQLEDLARIDGLPHVLYTVTGGTTDAPSQDVWVYNLSSGEAYPIYGRAEFESNITRVSLANDMLLVTIAEEGTTYLEFVDLTGQPIEVDAPFAAGSGTDFFSPVVQAVLSPDGSTMVYAQIQDVALGEEGFLIVDLVFWDLGTATEVDRLALNLGSDSEPDPTEWPARLDYDGTSLVLGRELSLLEGRVTITPLWIESAREGSVVELAVAGIPSLAK